MSTRHRRRLDHQRLRGAALPLLALLALGVVGCGDDDGATNDRTATVSLVVADVERSVSFYRALGLDIPDESIFVQDGVALHVTVPVSEGFDLDLDATAATRMWDPDFTVATSGARGILNFHVPDRDAVDSLYDAIVTAGHGEHLAPFDAFWGARYAVVLDPDGNLVGIMSADV